MLNDNFNYEKILKIEDLDKHFKEASTFKKLKDLQWYYDAVIHNVKSNVNTLAKKQHSKIEALKLKQISKKEKILFKYLKKMEDIENLYSQLKELNIDISTEIKKTEKYLALLDLLKIVKEQNEKNYNGSVNCNSLKIATPHTPNQEDYIKAICEIEPNFALTLNTNNNEITKEQLIKKFDDFWERLKKDNDKFFKDVKGYYSIEHEGTNIHIHCAVKLPYKIDIKKDVISIREKELEIQNYLECIFKNRYNLPSSNLHLVHIYDLQGWAKYMTKEINEFNEINPIFIEKK